MAAPTLVLPGVLFVGEDDRARTVAVTGAAAGWMRPKGLLQWSNEISVVSRSALTDEVKRDTGAVMPEEQIPVARMPLAHQAAQKAPLVAVAGKLATKLVERGVRVHTIGVDQITSSFYYLAEGGGEDPIRAEGDLIGAVGAMLGERADNAAIERAMDGLLDRLLRSLSGDRLDELSIELAAQLPRAANDGTGLKDVDLESFEREISQLLGGAEKYRAPTQQIADAIGRAADARVDLPLFGDARKVSQASLELALGDRKVALPTYDRWVMTGPFKEPVVAAPAPKPQPSPKPSPVVAAATPEPSPKPITPQPIVSIAPESPRPAPSPKPVDAVPRPIPRPPSNPAKDEAKADFAQAAPPAAEPAPVAKAEPTPAQAEAAAEPIEKAEKIERVEKAETKAAPIAEAPKAKPREPEARREIAKKSSGIPWLAIAIVLAFVILLWQFLLKK